jgi:hypothetical protein
LRRSKVTQNNSDFDFAATTIVLLFIGFHSKMIIRMKPFHFVYLMLLIFSLSHVYSASTIPVSQFSSLKSANTNSHEETKEEVSQHLQVEFASLSSIQNNLIQKLRNSHKIPVGQLPGSLRSHQHADSTSDDITQRVITSTEDHPIECRITLDYAPIGSKCIAPCACTGSQKWVQFSVFNKLRRKDPGSYITCPTCRTPYRYDIFINQVSNLSTHLLSQVLDQMYYVRLVALGIVVISAGILQAPQWILRFLVSETLWKQVSNHNDKYYSYNYSIINNIDGYIYIVSSMVKTHSITICI